MEKGRCCTGYRDITPGSMSSSKPMNESSASDIRHVANAYKDESTALTQYRCGLAVNEPRTLCHESPPEGTCGRVSLCIHTDLRIKISSQEKQVSRRSRKTRPIRAPFLILLFALILGLVSRTKVGIFRAAEFFDLTGWNQGSPMLDLGLR